MHTASLNKTKSVYQRSCF